MELRIEETPTRLRLIANRETIKFLRDQFKYRPPDYWRSPAYQLYKNTLEDPGGPKGWDGYKNLIEGYGPVTMMRGHKEELLTTCQDFDVKVTGTYLTSPFVGLTVDDIPSNIVVAPFDLDHHQRTCIIALLKSNVGVIRAAVSSGKTVLFGAVSAMIKARIPSARVLYVTPTERLVNQVYSEMKKFLPKWKISQAGGGKKDFSGRDMVVATMATLHKNIVGLVRDDWFKTFTVLLVDECHHLASESWSTVSRLVPAMFRFGASDTVKDERKEDIVKFYAIRGLLGPLRAEIEVSPLIKTGRVARPTLHLIDIPEWEGRYDDVPHVPELDTPALCLLNGEWHHGIYKGGSISEEVGANGEIESTDIKGFQTLELADRGLIDVESRWCLLNRAYDVAVIRNKERNKLIVDWTTHFAGEKKWPTLVVATRTLHVLIIETLLQRAGLEVRTLTGSDSTKKRDEVFSWVTATGGRVLVSPIVKEGVSMPELRGGVIADVVASPDLARQLIGRFIRKKITGSNTCEIVWFIDSQYKSARKNCLNLFKELEKIRGYSYRWPCSTPDKPAPLYEHASFD